MESDILKKLVSNFPKEAQTFPKLKEVTLLGFCYLNLSQANLETISTKEEFITHLKTYKNDKKSILSSLLSVIDLDISEEELTALAAYTTWWNLIIEYSILSRGLNAQKLSDFATILDSITLKKKIGAYYTPIDQIELICRLALYSYFQNLNLKIMSEDNLFRIFFRTEFPSHWSNKEFEWFNDTLLSLKISDPSCGSGLFLVVMFEILFNLTSKSLVYTNQDLGGNYELKSKILANLSGFDINHISVATTKINLYLKLNDITDTGSFGELGDFLDVINIKEADFLTVDEEIRSIDIFIGNPPFVRHHGISSNTKFQFQELLSRNLDLKLDEKADLYVYFWLKTAIYLKEKGIIAFVLSRSWYSSKFSKIIMQSITKSLFQLDMIIELPFEMWQNADIKTHIVICNKSRGTETNLQLRLIVWKKDIEKFYKRDNPLKQPKYTKKYFTKNISLQLYEEADFRYFHLSNQKEIANEILIPSRELFIPIIRFDYLLMPILLFQILYENSNNFSVLGELGDIKMGSTTGANRYFYLDSVRIQSFEIPPKYLHPMTKTPREWSVFGNFSPNTFLLHITQNKEDITPSVTKYLNSITDEVLKRPYFKNKRNSDWYHVPLIQPDILIPNMIYKRSFVVNNYQKLHIDKQWIGFTANNYEDVFFLMIFFNSTLGILLREIQGTKTLGLGALKLSHKEVQNLLVINPEAVPNSRKHKIKLLYDQLRTAKIGKIILKGSTETKSYLIRKEIDFFILVECLGYSESIVIELEEILEFEYKWRMIKSLSRRD